MQVLKNYSFVCILGKLWMPNATAAQMKYLTQHDINNMTHEEGSITRDSVDSWLCTHSGDFSSIIDFKADIETNKGNTVIDWQEEENEFIYGDCMNEFDEA